MLVLGQVYGYQDGHMLSTTPQGAIDCKSPLVCRAGTSSRMTIQAPSNATTATALAANPTDCAAGQYAKSIDARGNLTCEAPAGGSTPNVTCAADEALRWNGSAWSCISKVREAFYADAGITAQTATALASNPTDCTAGQYAKAIDTSGNLTCAQVTGDQVSGAVATATALAADPADCGAGQYASGINASGALTCSTPPGAGTKYMVTTNNVTNNTTSPATITGLSWSVTSGTEYGFHCVILGSGTATSLPRFNINGPATTHAGFLTQRMTTTSAQTLLVLKDLSASAQTAACTSSCNTTVLPTIIQGVVLPSANGTMAVQVTSSTSGQTVTVYRGSFCEVF